MERLSHIVEDAVESGRWKPISLSAGGPLLSHLFYADDLVLFASADEGQAKVIADCLQHFSQASGLAVSREKSAIFCSKNTARPVAGHIATILGMPLTQNLGTYLGVPMLHSRVLISSYQYILDRMDQRLSGWKTRSLTLAGRVTMAQSVLAAIPVYAMQTTVLPATVCEEIDKRIQNFVWGSSRGDKKIHLMPWEQICRPKEEGGLGLRLSRQLNLAYMTKLAFIFFQDPNRLWVRLLQSKYFKDSARGLQPRHTSSVSTIWKGITSAWPTMERGSRSGLRNGRDTLFWTSRWLDDGSRLIDLADESNPRISLDDSFVLQTGDWDLARIRDLLPPAAVNSVAGMTPPNDSLGEDAWSWGGESNGKFTIRSAYNLITGSSSPPTGTDWKKVWNWRGPNKIRLFLWLASHNKLLTNEERRRRHLAGDDSCPRCPGRCESSTHVIKDCPFAVEVWRLLGLDQIAFPAGLSHHDNWIFQHLSHEEGLLFGCVFWALWKSRNELVFNGVTVSAQATAYRIASWVKTVEDSLSRDQRLGGQPVHERRDVSWTPGPTDWLVINTDGSVKQP
ncbi:Putative ribonuclease H protein At1g65750 [Linum perenne]